MAVTLVRTRRGYDHTYAFGQYAPDRRFTAYYWVYSDTVAEDPLAIRGAAGVPQPGDVHPTDIGCIVQSVRLRRDEDYPKRWEVEVEYSNQTRNVEDEEPEDLEDYEKITVMTRQGQRLLERDRNDALILNSAGDLIEGVTVPWNALSIQIVQFTTSAPDYYVTSKWINAINSATWRGVPAYFAKIVALNYEEAKIENTDCWQRTAIVDLAHTDAQPWGWRHRLLDAGLREKVSANTRKHIRDEKTQLFASRPFPLDGSGAKLADGGTPVFFDVEVYPELPFATLGI